MAANDWVNSYLEAIIDAGPPIDDAKSSLLLRERGHFSPTRYFVEEVVSGFDETDLHRSWLRVSTTRSPQERNTRLENMCWRIWNLARKKKQLEGEEAQRAAKRRLERERGRIEATADMSDLSEGEKGELTGGEGNRGRLPRIGSVETVESWASQHKDRKLYIVLISLHGLIRGENMELGRDSDTGGQVKYVVELARALGEMPGVYRVDLLTRQVSVPEVDWSYGEPTEMLSPRKNNSENIGMGESSGAYIVRIPFGPRDKYLQKELLWPHIAEFVDAALGHIIQIARVLGEQIGGGQPVWPVAIHGHYADAGDSAALLSGALNVPMIFTGHSLGRDKLEQLMKQGRQSREEINVTYKIARRIEAEEQSLDVSEVVITSTRQEIDEQWRLYDGFDPIIERKLRVRIKRSVSCYGRFMPRMVVVPPGMEFHHIIPHDGDTIDGGADADSIEDGSSSHDPPIWSEIMRFFSNPRKPMILALARPDPKKNITTLVKAFGECRHLRELANLTLVMGNRDNIDDMSSTNSSVLLSILKMIDKYDLYGQVAYPKHHKQREVRDIYRLAAKTKGVFINPAFIEPFGLTLIEAAGYGLPIVATKNGGPVDIHRVLDNGLLVDPHDQQAISDALLKLVADKQLWARCRHNGLKYIHLFSWPEHCKAYLTRIACCRPRQPQWLQHHRPDGIETSEESNSPGDSLRDIQDISLNLKLPIDGGGGAIDNVVLDSGEVPASSGLESAVLSWSKSVLGNRGGNNHRLPSLKRKTAVLVVAVDCGDAAEALDHVERIVGGADDFSADGCLGLILSTSFTISEIHSVLARREALRADLDALICSSGSEIYYPSSSGEDGPTGLPYVLDSDYHSHTEYRWGGEDLRRTLVRWSSSVNDRNERAVLTEDDGSSSTHCYSFRVSDPMAVPTVKELRKVMRIQALRCHVVYCRNGTSMRAIPVLASRAQALRYLHVRWGMDLSAVVVFVGEYGDTDYEHLLGGLHTTIILKGVATDARCLHSNRNYSLNDVVAFDNPRISQSDDTVPAIRAALRSLLHTKVS